MNTSRGRWWITCLLVACVYGCADRGAPREAQAQAPETRAPFDVRSVVEQVRFAFRARDTGWEGGHGTYAVRVEAGGFSVKPYHHLQPRESEPARVVEGEAVRFGAARVARGEAVLSEPLGPGRVEDSGALTVTRGQVAEHFRNGPGGVEQSWSFEQRPEGQGDLEVRLPVESGRFVGESARGLHFASGPAGLGVSYSHGLWVDARGERTAVPAHFEAGHIVLRVPTEVLEASAWPAVLDPTVSPELGMDNPVSGPASQDQFTPAVAYDGANFLVVWEDFRAGGGDSDLYGARVSGTGTVLDTHGLPISTAAGSQSAPSVAHDGTSFLVVWRDSRSGGGSDIYGARVSGTGTVVDPNGLPISTAAGSQSAPAVAHDGTSFLVVWQDSRGATTDIYGARVSGAGAVQDTNGIAISTAANAQTVPAVAYDGTNFLVVWQDSRGATSDIYGARVSRTGVVQETNGIAISTAANAQVLPAVAHDGTNFLVVWQDSRGATSDIYGARVSGAGSVLDSNGIAISTATTTQSAPKLAFDGTNHLVVWEDYRNGTNYNVYDIYGARVSKAGSVLDSAGLAIAAFGDRQLAPTVAHDGTNFFVFWQDSRSAGNTDIYGARVSSGAKGMTVMDAQGVLISRSANRQAAPAVAYDGTDFLVVWEDFRNGASDIYGARVSGTGTVLTPNGIAISTEGNNQSAPSVAFDGTNFLVVWEDFRNGNFSDIYGARVSKAGGLLDFNGLVISNAARSQSSPSVAFDGTNFLVVWEDLRGGTSDIYGSRVSKAGGVLNSPSIAISTAAGIQAAPAVAHGGTSFLVVWEDRRGATADIYGARVSATGTVQDTNGLAISTAASAQVAPSVAHDGTNFLVVWQDSRGGASDIYGARVSGAGAVLDTSGLALSTADNHQSSPAVTHDGTNFLVVWQDQRGGRQYDVHGTRVSGAGSVLDTSGFTVSAEPMDEWRPAVVSMGGRRSLVVYGRFHLSASTNSERVLASFVSNATPVATARSVSTDEDTSVALTLTGTDADGDSLTYTVVQQPTRGTLTGTPPNLTYQPAADYDGSDSFTFRVNDGLADSTVATVSLTVRAINDAPVATAQSASTDEDTPVALTLTGTDVDGDNLTYTVVLPPAHGSLTGTPPNLTYQPAADYHGPDSFTFRVTDPSGASSTQATVTLTVRSVSDAPVATARSVSTDEDTPVGIVLTGTDVDGDSLTYTVVQQPTRGTLSGTAPNLTYQPAAHFHGSDSFTFRVTDSTGLPSTTATVSLTVRPVNDAPVATAQSASTDEDTSLALTLVGTDVDGDSLTYTVVQQPANGTLSGTAPNLTYQPAANYHGPDSFTFRVTDSSGVTSNLATVGLTVRSVNDAPVATAQSAILDEDTSAAVTLVGSDVDGDSLTYTVVKPPDNGSTTGTPPNLTYQPNAHFHGSDTITYRVTDSAGVDSNLANIYITVRSINDAPVAESRSVATDEDTALALTLVGTDVDGDALTYTVVQQPSNGTLSGTAPNFTYQPAANFHGSDSLTFRVTDTSGVTSNLATLSLTVRSVNDAPVAESRSASTDEDTPLALTLAGTDVDGDSLTYALVQQPANGTLTGTAPNLTYQPNAHFHGTDSFTFRVTDSSGVASNVATVSLTVRSVNDTPEALAQSATLDEDTSVTLTLVGTDADGDALTYTVVQQPSNGTLSGTAPNLTYQPNAHFHGTDSLTFQVTDTSGVTSNVATVTFTVRPINDAPVASAQSVATDEDTPLALTLVGTDVDGDSLTYTVVQQPTNGTLSGTAPNFTYQPAANFHGADSLSFQVTDTSGVTSNVATVSLTVRSVNDAPVALAQSATLDEDTSIAVTLTGTDVEGETLTYAVVRQPRNGTLTGTAPNLTYQPKANFNGTDSFTFRVTDASGASSTEATVTFTVNPVNDAPVAIAQGVTLKEDTSVNVTLSGVEVDGDPLTFTVVKPPTNGTISGTPPHLVYQPNANFYGSDTITFQATDPSGVKSNLANIYLTVQPMPDAPVAESRTVTTDEDTSVAVTLVGKDPDGDSITYTLVQQPTNGTLSGTAPNLTYQPAANFHGSDALTFQVTDSTGLTSNLATVTLTVRSINDAPVANAQSVSTDEDTSVALTLTGADTEGDSLTYAVVRPPANGTLSGTPPNLTYQPSANFHGSDSFTFRVNDGLADSAEATVTVTVRPTSDAPMADAQSVATDEDTPVAVTLTGTDVDGDALTYTVVQQPANGTLSGTAPDLTYQPAADFHGSDSFTFQVTDSTGLSSSAATVTLTVLPVNDAPVATARSVATDEDTPVTVTLTGTDVDGDSLTYTVVQQPSNGTLSGTAPGLTYQPNANFHGSDSFTFQVSDGVADSAEATVTLTVRPVNDAPVANAQSASTDEDTPVTVTLTGTDVDGDSLTYTVVRPPANGTLSGTAPNLTYQPSANFQGSDSFTFRVNDGLADSAVATVTLTVSSANDAPVANAQSVATDEDTPVAITLTGTDSDGDNLTYTVVQQPTHGTLSGTVPHLTYQPSANFHGSDSFTFRVNDGMADSAVATVTLTVRPVNDAPVANAQSASTDEDTPVALTLTGSDVDGDSLTYSVVRQPANGTLSGTGSNLTYQPSANFHGSDSFTFQVTDSTGLSSSAATVTLTVNPVNDAPVANAQSVATDEDTPVALTLTGTDVDGDSLTYTVVQQPTHGTLSGTVPDLTYQPNANFHGPDSFTFSVSDGQATSSIATVTLTVAPVNDVPVAQPQTVSVNLDSTPLTLAATDVDGDALTYTLESLPTEGTLSGTPPELVYTQPAGFQGTVSFTFSASDGQATSAPATVTLHVYSSIPQVTISASTLKPLEGEAVLFTATAENPSGEPLTYAWDFGDGATSEDSAPAHTYVNEGTYEVVLTVSNGVDTGRATLTLEVLNTAPFLVPLDLPATAEEGKPLTFQASASDSGSTDTLTYSWDFGDGSSSASGAQVTHTYADDGLYTVTVTVQDNAGASTQASRQVQVSNLPPLPEPREPLDTLAGEEVRVELRATDIAGEKDPLTWTLVEGPGALTPEGLYTWTPPESSTGEFLVRARVADDEDGANELLFRITVRAATQPPPTEPPPSVSAPTSGCGCNGTGEASASAALLLVALASRLRRRASRRGRLST